MNLKKTSTYKQIIKEMPEGSSVKDEFDRMLPRFDALDEGKAVVAMKLLARVAFMTVQLADIERHIDAEGVREMYQNGANQSGYKKSTYVEVYNAMIKNYATLTKQLADMLPEDAPKLEDDGFESFVARRG